MKKTFKSKKIFIAGHKGMVGSALCSYLRKMNFNNIITASRSKLDLTDSDKVQKFIKRKKPNVVINCAGKVGGIMANYNFPTQFLLENIKIQINLAESCFKNNIENVIFLGSSCIYPKFAKQPMKPEMLMSGLLEPTNSAYATSKAALSALTREMASDFGPLGNRVNAIAPGEIKTDIISPESEKVIVPKIPLGRFGTPDEVAQTIYFLCSDMSDYLNGSEIHINGGQHV